MQNAQDSPHPEPTTLKFRRKHRRSKPQLLTRDHLDRRSNAYKLSEAITAKLVAELGGFDRLNTKQRMAVEAMVGAYIIQHNIITRMLMGEEIDVGAHASAVHSMLRAGACLPDPEPKDVTPTLAQYLQQQEEAEAS